MKHYYLLRQIYDDALNKVTDETITFDLLDDEVKQYVEYIISRSEFNKGMVTVLTTLLVHKLVTPEQDIRYHQAGLEGGFAGRGIDILVSELHVYQH